VAKVDGPEASGRARVERALRPSEEKFALDLRVIEFLSKPVNPMKLFEAVSRHAWPGHHPGDGRSS
jgi:hypothetical protein